MGVIPYGGENLINKIPGQSRENSVSVFFFGGFLSLPGKYQQQLASGLALVRFSCRLGAEGFERLGISVWAIPLGKVLLVSQHCFGRNVRFWFRRLVLSGAVDWWLMEWTFSRRGRNLQIQKIRAQKRKSILPAIPYPH